jgi:adenosylhomocysteinase
LNNEVRVEDYMDDEMVAKVISTADFVVTATGLKNALTKSAVSAILANTKAVVANMGVEDEFGELVPDTRVLNRKSPLNFVLDEPTHLKYIDASLALHAALGERLLQDCATEPFIGVQDPPSEIEQRLLVTTIQNGAIGPEISDMLR